MTLHPFYQDGLVTIYHGDSREVLPRLEPGFSAIITDPVWPNALRASPKGRRPHQRMGPLAGTDDPYGLFVTVMREAPRLASRLVVVLGCDSDPRFVAAVPAALPFVRLCWLRYAVPTYRGRVLVGSDVAYVFGNPPPARKGGMVLPGEVTFNAARPRLRVKHPAARRFEHMEWLVGWFGGGTVLDPFAGSGTTLAACKARGLPSVGIEIEERYCELAARSVAQEVMAI